MKLVILRHAVAVPHDTPGVAEDERPLTPEGIEKMQKAARGLRVIAPEPDLVLTSPLPRAKQTAELFLAAFPNHGRPALEDLPALGPGGRRLDVYRALDERRDLGCVVLVGHQPSLGEIAGEIAWGSPEHYVELKKGGACAIDLQNTRPTPRGSMTWLLTPAILRFIAK